MIKIETRDQEPKMQKDDEELIAINGFQQVVDLFKAADQSFRSSLIKRIADKNPSLARQIINELNK